MEDEKSFSDICGGRLALRRRYYSPYCREFGLSSARLSLCSLTAVTCAVWLAAYGLFTLCEVKASARPSQRTRKGLGADPWVREGGDSLDQGCRPAQDCPPSPRSLCFWTFCHSGPLALLIHKTNIPPQRTQCILLHHSLQGTTANA